MAFSRWKDVPEVNQAVEKLDDYNYKYRKLLATGKTDDKVQAAKIWQNMSSCYWEILFAIVDAQTKNNPEILQFDDEERIFIDLGSIPGLINLSKDFDANKYLASKCAGGILPALTLSDYIAECWAAINGTESPTPVIGMSLDERINYLNGELLRTQQERNSFLREIDDNYPNNLDVRQLIANMNSYLISAMKVNMRVPEYREGSDSVRQKFAQERKAYIDAEKSILLLVSSAQKNESNPLPAPQVEKFLAIHDKTKVIAKKILYSQIDAVKIARRVKKISDNCSGMSAQMRRGELKNMLVKKRDYLTVPGKNARADTSLLCQPDSMPADYAKMYSILEDFDSLDIEMFNVPRVRMYGIPRAIFVPGQGLGSYDWQDHSLLIPAFPIGGEDKSASYALGTFRWDSDEDRRLKTPYEQQIKENRKKSLLALAEGFYKDYALWMTKEKKGYRILPRETHKVFINMFTAKPEE